MTPYMATPRQEKVRTVNLSSNKIQKFQSANDGFT